jgi:anti-sigma factor RsiW
VNVPHLHSLTGAYAADALDREEREEFEAHLAECAPCRDEVAELVATTARLAEAVSTPPPPGLKARVLAEAGQTRQLSPLPTVTRLYERPTRRWYTQPASVAAALLLVVSAGLGAYALDERSRAEQAEQRAERITAIVTDPDRVELTVPASSGGTGTVVAADGVALFRASDLRELPEDQEYQLWRIRGDEPQSVGVLGRGGAFSTLVTDIARTDSLGLTVEPKGGSRAPTGELVLRLPLA